MFKVFNSFDWEIILTSVTTVGVDYITYNIIYILNTHCVLTCLEGFPICSPTIIDRTLLFVVLSLLQITLQMWRLQSAVAGVV